MAEPIPILSLDLRLQADLMEVVAGWTDEEITALKHGDSEASEEASAALVAMFKSGRVDSEDLWPLEIHFRAPPEGEQ